MLHPGSWSKWRHLSREALIQVILDQQRMIMELRAEIEQLKRRGGPAPFSKGKAKKNPKRAGRKPGQGTFRNRKVPEQSSPVEPVAVPVSGCCSECGRGFGEAGHRGGVDHRYSAGETSRSAQLCNRDTPVFRVW
jgi:hypothetical protein